MQSMTPAGSLHPQVNNGNGKTQEKIHTGQYQPNTDDLSSNEMDDEFKAISKVWPESPPGDRLHIFVRVRVHRIISSERFFFSLVLGLFSNALSLFSHERRRNVRYL